MIVAQAAAHAEPLCVKVRTRTPVRAGVHCQLRAHPRAHAHAPRCACAGAGDVHRCTRCGGWEFALLPFSLLSPSLPRSLPCVRTHSRMRAHRCGGCECRGAATPHRWRVHRWRRDRIKAGRATAGAPRPDVTRGAQRATRNIDARCATCHVACLAVGSPRSFAQLRFATSARGSIVLCGTGYCN
jgi:hypothetical protein